MLSIIIPTLNEEKYLPSLLQDLKAQTNKDIEIIVADSYSQDSTSQIAKKYGARIILCSKGKGPAGARNEGARIAKGEYLLFLDADVRIQDSKFIYKLMKKVECEKIKIATFFMTPNSNRKIDHLVQRMVNWIVKFFRKTEPLSPGFGLFVAKEVHDRIGGFREDLAIAEDHNYAKRATKYVELIVIEDLQIVYSVRRLEKEGRLRIYFEYFIWSLYRILFGEVKKEIFKYEYGAYK
jgi:glycosyltransferase involved in cell wall biosynthesis